MILNTVPEIERALGIPPNQRFTDDSDSQQSEQQPDQADQMDQDEQVNQEVNSDEDVVDQEPENGDVSVDTSVENVTREQRPPDRKPPQGRRLTDRERARLFQSRAGKLETENKLLQQKLQTMEEKLDLLTTIFGSQFQQVPPPVYGQSRLSEHQPVKETREPDIRDFIPDYDPNDGIVVTDPRYQQYLKAREKWNAEQLEERITRQVSAKLEEAQRLQRLKQDADELCARYPEYRLLNGEPNWQKIKNDLGPYVSIGSLVEAKEFLDYKMNRSKGQKSNYPTNESILEQIESRANASATGKQKVPSVTNSPVVSGKTLRMSEEAKMLFNVFGQV